jgi:hypothetical protein
VTLALVSLFGISAHAQDTKLTLVAVDGRNGKPMPAQRLLVFVGESPDDVRLHKHSLDVTTDKDGTAILAITQANIQWIQVLVDFRTLCQTKPNLQSFNVGEIVSSGMTTPNTCGSFRRDVAPSQLIVFARPATLREKMNW